MNIAGTRIGDLPGTAAGTLPRTRRAGVMVVDFPFLELRHKAELHNPTCRVVECPLDEMNRPRASVGPHLQIPSGETEIEELFTG